MYSLVNFGLLKNITYVDTLKHSPEAEKPHFGESSFFSPPVPWFLKYLTCQFRASILSDVFNKKTNKTRAWPPRPPPTWRWHLRRRGRHHRSRRHHTIATAAERCRVIGAPGGSHARDSGVDVGVVSPPPRGGRAMTLSSGISWYRWRPWRRRFDNKK